MPVGTPSPDSAHLTITRCRHGGSFLQSSDIPHLLVSVMYDMPQLLVLVMYDVPRP